MSSTSRSFARAGAPVLFFVLASLVLNVELLPHVRSALPGNAGDPMLNAWILGWVSETAVTRPSEIWNAPIFHPHENTLALSEHLMGIAAVVAPVYWVTRDAILTYNVAFLAGYAFLGWATFVLVRGLTGRTDAALLAGAVVMSSPYFTSSQVARLQVLSAGWSLLTLHWLHSWCATGRGAHLAAFAACWLVQLNSNLYFGVFLCLPVGTLLAYWVATGRLALSRRRVAHLLVAGALLGLAVAPVARQYARARDDLGVTHSLDEVRRYSASLQSYGSVWHERRPAWLWAEEGSDRALYPGTPLVLLALGGLGLALWRRSDAVGRRDVLAFAVMAVAVFAVTLGPDVSPDGRASSIPGPYALLSSVPGFDSIRAPGRMAAFVVIALGAIGGIGAAALLAGGARSLRYGTVATIAAVTFTEGHRDYDWLAHLPDEDPSATAAYDWLATQPRAAILEMPVVSTFQAQPRYAGGSITLRYQLAALRHKHALVNGSSGFTTPLVTLLQSHASPFTTLDSIDDALQLLRAVGTRYVVAHRHEYVPEALAHVDEIQAAMRADIGQVEAVHEFGTTVVLVLRPAPAAEPPVRRVRIDPDAFRVAVSHNSDVAHQLTDGELTTRWMGPQHGRTWVDVHLKQTQVVSGIKLAMPRFGVADYPHHLRVVATGDDGEDHVLFDGPTVYEAAMAAVHEPAEPGVRITWPARAVSRLRLEQPVVAGDRQWAIYEVHLLSNTEAN